ncbi:MAG: indolepyruvate oxidoreductase subunit beta [Candidatus Aenigmarchaeota archaeon]|nr:indolepyruvate oxidoreductase subunit beta [Candidatus Aenigmarchaeota archaeon]
MNDFNIVLTGVGGQGILTLQKIISEAAMKQGYDVKASELHGLSQRGGHIECHVRIGKKIHSSLVRQGNADLIIALEPLEGLRATYYASKQKTIFLLNTYEIIPLSVYIGEGKYPSMDKILDNIKDFSKKIFSINASEIVKRTTGSIISTNIYMLGYAVAENIIPIKKEFVLDGMKKVIKKKYFEMNKKVFELRENHIKRKNLYFKK